MFKFTVVCYSSCYSSFVTVPVTIVPERHPVFAYTADQMLKQWKQNLGHPQRRKGIMASRRRCELRPLMTNGKGDASLATIGRSDHHNTPICQANQRPDSELAGLRQADEGRVSPMGGGQRRESSPTASCYYIAAEVEAQAVLPSSLARWSWLSSPRNCSPEDQLVSTQEGAAPQGHKTCS